MAFALQLPTDFIAYVGSFALRSFLDDSGHWWSWRDNGRAGATLVLLPGAMGNGDMAFRIAQAFGDAVRTVSVTYPSGVAAEALADGLRQLFDHAGIDRAAVWGSSYGAWWAQAFAGRFVERVSALWLGNMPLDGNAVAAHPLFRRAWLMTSSPEQVALAWQEAVAKRPPDELQALQSYMLQEGLPPADFCARLLRVCESPVLEPVGECERLVICDCADDTIVDPVQADRVHARYPHAQHVHLPEGGHYPHVTRHHQLVARMREWLAVR